MPRTPFDDDADEGKDLGAFKKPHKLSSAVAADEDLVAYYRALEVPLADALARVRGVTTVEIRGCGDAAAEDEKLATTIPFANEL